MANIGDCLLLYLFPSVQYPGVLADPSHVLHHPLLHHYEETDQGEHYFECCLQQDEMIVDLTELFSPAHDPIPIPSVHVGQA